MSCSDELVVQETGLRRYGRRRKECMDSCEPSRLQCSHFPNKGRMFMHGKMAIALNTGDALKMKFPEANHVVP